MNFHSLQLVNEGNNNNGCDPTASVKIMRIFHRFYRVKFEVFFSFLQ